jgi:hypothetical protein
MVPPWLARTVTALAVSSCGLGDEPARLHTSVAAPAASGGIAIEAREPLLPTYPCSRCHGDRAPDPRERPLTEFHAQKKIEHGTASGWCYRCHTPASIDRLHLADGTLVRFDEAYELCGSCHGDKYRDWKAGIHGLTTGWWLGARTRRSCTACHDPHSPRFAPMTPERPPAPPRTAPAEPAPAEEER